MRISIDFSLIFFLNSRRRSFYSVLYIHTYIRTTLDAAGERNKAKKKVSKMQEFDLLPKSI